MRSPLLATLFVLVLLVPSPPALAGDDSKAAQKHIAVLVHEARALEAEGRPDAARVLWKRAHELKARLAERAQDGKRTPLTREHAEKVLHGLEMGMEALKAVRRHDELKAVAKVADEIRKLLKKAHSDHDGRDAEIDAAKRRLEVLRAAFHGLREGEKREAMERMEHAIHALELRIEGRRDEEAQEIRRTAPKVGEQIELLQLAAKLWDGFGHERKAEAIHGLAEELAAASRRKTDRVRRAPTDRKPVEREVVEKRRKVVRFAMAAFREAEKPHLAEQMERLLHAYEIALAGRKDDEAREIWRQAPGREEQAELMASAAHLYAEWGHEERAHALMALSHELRSRKADRLRTDRRPGARAEPREHLERLQGQLHEIREMVERLEKELQALRRRPAER